MSLIPKSIATCTFQIALPGWTQDHDKGRPETMLFFKLVPLPISHKPGIIEKGIEDYTGVVKFVMDFSQDTAFQKKWNLETD